MGNRKKYLDWILPLGLFAAITAVSELTRHYSYIQKENLGLFLNSPDWMKALRNDGGFLFNCIGSFVCQFFDLPLVGALTTALCITLPYLLVRAILRRSGLKCRSEADLALCLLLAGGYAAYSLLSEEVGQKENWSKVEICARNHEWSKVLEVATPEAAAKDRELLPYAILAMGGNGSLSSHLFDYPVEGPQDMDRDGDVSRRGYYFTSLLYECLGSPNEAVHNLFQAACFLPHGTSSMVLRQLVKLNIENQNYTLVRKYLRVLESSPRNRPLARKALKMYADRSDVADSTAGSSALAAVITKAPMYNLAQIQALGNRSPFVVDRLLCSLLLERDLDNFRQFYSKVDRQGASVPRHYEEALLLSGADPKGFNISQATNQKYAEFISAMKSGDIAKARTLSARTYWRFYYREELERQ